ncbi:MAG TPA: hypothetical protein VK837_13240 [Longimicrobiales bacterium]|nr:hypothetical protein [Longimicrobiales bacterium]
MGCLRRVASLVVLLVVAGAVWLYWGDDIGAALDGRRGGGEPALAGPELADATMRRIAELAETPGARIALSEAELQSLIDHEYRAMIPAFLASPRVGVNDNTVRLSGRVSTAFIEEYVDLGDAAAFLPDTADVAVRGHLIPAEAGRVGLSVEQVSAARIPLPDALVGRLLRSAGAGSDAALGDDVIPINLPEPLESAYVHGDSVVLTARD